MYTQEFQPPKTDKPVYKKAWFWLLTAFGASGAFIVFVLAVGALVGPPNDTNHAEQHAPTETAESPAASDVPREWESALNRADVLASRDYSKEGTYRTLMSAYDFPADAAQYAVDSVEADWKANALNKAQDLQNRDYSHKQIGRILSSAYDFTEEEADYALANLEP